MSLSKVRTYFRNQFTATDSKFKEWDDAFNSANIPSNIIDKAYHITYSVPSSDPFSTHLTDNVEVSVSVFFKGYKKPTDTLDMAMDLCNEFRLNCVSISNIESFKSTDDNPIYGVISNSITPTFVETNDNRIVVELSFTVSVAHGIC